VFRRMVLGLVVLLFVVTFSTAQEEGIEFPVPTGPHQVGSTYRVWVDESRPEVLTEDPDDEREVLVRIWYPADVAGDAEPMPAMPHADIYIPILDRVAPAFSGFARFLDEIAALESHTYLDAPIVDSGTPFPVVVFSHCLGCIPELYSIQLEELASHGYVVVGTYHQFAAAAVYPDGRVVEQRNVAPQVGADDQRFVMDQLALINADDPEGMFTGMLQADTFGAFGMASGGEVADILCRTDERCAAYANEDGLPVNRATPTRALPPVMLMAPEVGGMRGYFEQWSGTAYYLRFGGLTTPGFSDLPLWPGTQSLIVALREDIGLAGIQAINAYLVAFFDTYLKGEPSPLLDGPSNDYPDVEFESRNIE
jgi:hypothetical protein